MSYLFCLGSGGDAAPVAPPGSGPGDGNGMDMGLTPIGPDDGMTSRTARVTAFHVEGIEDIPGLPPFAAGGEVPLGFDLTGMVPFVFGVDNPQNVDGTFSIDQGRTTILEGISPSATRILVPVQEMVFTRNSRVQFDIYGQDVGGRIVARRYILYAPQTRNLSFYGVRSTLPSFTPGEQIDIDSFQSQTINSMRTFMIDVAFPSGSYLIIYVPSSQHIAEINVISGNFINAFTEVDDAGLIDNVHFRAYYLHNRSGRNGRAPYQIVME